LNGETLRPNLGAVKDEAGKIDMDSILTAMEQIREQGGKNDIRTDYEKNTEG
jgi:hypothetical protein